MPRKTTPAKKKPAKPRVHKDLEGFEISIDTFGELKSNLDIEKINEFLNRNVDDKKLAERNDYEEIKKGRKRKKK
ncbi:MAG: hypothetical protein KatS3mg032_0917 [Cyclobacteriaceae bacterium]|nr:MAG: hypothetical protein KatS3mg032_0917 [Cyclobacteriaceae bacterium]